MTRFTDSSKTKLRSTRVVNEKKKKIIFIVVVVQSYLFKRHDIIYWLVVHRVKKQIFINIYSRIQYNMYS